MVTKKESKPNEEGGRKRLPYVQGVTPKLTGRLFPSDGAEVSAKRAIEVMEIDFPRLIKFKKRKNYIYNRILIISDEYWNEYDYHERGNGDDVRSDIKEIIQAIDILSKKLNKHSNHHTQGIFRTAVAVAINNGFNTTTAAQRAQALELIEVLLRVKIEIPKPRLRGKPANDYIRLAAMRLISSYESWSEKPYLKNFERARGREGNIEFTSLGPQFVWRILSAIDPRLELGTVMSALKSLPPSSSQSQ